MNDQEPSNKLIQSLIKALGNTLSPHARVCTNITSFEAAGKGKIKSYRKEQKKTQDKGTHTHTLTQVHKRVNGKNGRYQARRSNKCSLKEMCLFLPIDLYQEIP